MENYRVYKHTTPNNKIYIGITCQKPTIRWGNGCNYKNQPYFSLAIQKYGWKNIKHEVLFENLTKDQAETKEIELISFYKSNNREFGYNIDNGGKSKGRCSEETKRKISQIQKGRKQSQETIDKRLASRIGYTHSKETREKISNANKNKVRSEEIKRAISERQKGKKLSNTHKLNISNGLKKSWTQERRDFYSNRIIGNKNPNFNRKFTQEEIINLQLKNRGANSKLSKKVGQFDLEGNLIHIFDSAREAGRNGYTTQCITCVCRGERKTYKNYIWKYLGE